MITFDLNQNRLTEVNKSIQDGEDNQSFTVINPAGAHNLGVGLKTKVNLLIDGPSGYYCGSMNQNATIQINGSCSQGVGSNIMSGLIKVNGNAGASCGATGHGGLIVVEGGAGSRCGIAMKGVDIVVKGSVGHMSGFMGQAGALVICGDAGDALADSCYEISVFVKGTVKSLGVDCEPKTMTAESKAKLESLLKASGSDFSASEFKEYGPARKLYSFKVDDVNADEQNRK